MGIAARGAPGKSWAFFKWFSIVNWIAIMAILAPGCSVKKGLVPPTPSPIFAPTPVLVLAYEDDFSDQDSGWDDAFDKYTMKQYGRHKYHITVSASNLFAWGLANRDLSDFILEVGATHEEGSFNSSYGIIFRLQDAQNFYRFDVSGDGFYLLSKFVDGQWETLVDWTESPSINQGQTTNILKVACQGSRIGIYSNGQLLAEVEDRSFSHGDIGLFAGTFSDPEIHISFDNLKVWAPRGTLIALRPKATPLPPTDTPQPPTDTPIPPSPTVTLPNMPKPRRTSPTPGPSPTPEETPTFTPTPTPTLEAMPDYVSAEQPKARKAPTLTGKIAFPVLDPKRGTYDIYMAGIDGSNRQRVATEASQPDLSPDGTHIVFRSWAGDRRGLIAREVYGEGGWRFVVYNEAARPCWSPDGQMFLFHSRQESDRRSRIYRTEGTRILVFRRHEIDVFGDVPAWMPDKRILYRACEYGRCGIYIMNFDGSFPSQLTDDISDTAPAVSSDGQIAFMSRRDGSWEIYTVDLDSKVVSRLTENEANDGLPTWSPDGQMIAFVSDRNGQWGIWVMNADGSNQNQLFPLEGSPDGSVRDVADYECSGWTEERISWSP